VTTTLAQAELSRDTGKLSISKDNWLTPPVFSALEEANGYLTREYRKPYVLPDNV